MGKSKFLLLFYVPNFHLRLMYGLCCAMRSHAVDGVVLCAILSFSLIKRAEKALFDSMSVIIFSAL